MDLPCDSHVHSEFSWDTGGPRSGAAGRMRATCARAARIGLPAIVLTEHLDLPRRWRAAPEDLEPHQRGLIDDDGLVAVEVLDAAGYLESVDRCRREFPDLQILTGVELGQPHLAEREVAAVVDLDLLDRVNGSLHTLDLGGGAAEPSTLYREHPPEVVMRAYLAEIPAMVAGAEAIDVVCHLDYAARTWPDLEAGPFDPRAFEEEFRAALHAIAGADLALEMNTQRLWPWLPQWWTEEGGRAVTFGSDAHEPDVLGRHFPEAVQMVGAYGFREGPNPWDPWRR